MTPTTNTTTSSWPSVDDLKRQMRDITSGMYYELKDNERSFNDAEKRVVDQILALVQSHYITKLQQAEVPYSDHHVMKNPCDRGRTHSQKIANRNIVEGIRVCIDLIKEDGKKVENG